MTAAPSTLIHIPELTHQPGSSFLCILIALLSRRQADGLRLLPSALILEHLQLQCRSE